MKAFLYPRGKSIEDATQIRGIETKFTIQNGLIQSKITTMDKTLGEHGTAISQTIEDIDLRVRADGVISSINLSGEGIKIQASKLDIEGKLTLSAFQNSVKTGIEDAIQLKPTIDGWTAMENNQTVIDGSKILTGSIDVKTLKAGTIDANKVKIAAGNVTIDGNGITIVGGLREDQLDPGLAEKWNEASELALQIASADVLLASRKNEVRQQYETTLVDYDRILRQAATYQLSGASEILEMTSAKNSYYAFLYTENDLSNGMPPLAAGNLNNNSSIDGEIYIAREENFRRRVVAANEIINMKMADAIDDTNRRIAELDLSGTYQITIQSSDGNVFRNGQISTVLTAKVYQNKIDMTDSLPPSAFRWSRHSYDSASDNIWNQNNGNGVKTLTVTNADIIKKATFTCTLSLE